MRQLGIVGLLVAAAVMLVGCGGNSGGSTLSDPLVQFRNASTDAGNLQLRIDDTTRASGGYLGGPAEYIRLSPTNDPDGYDFSIHDAGTGADLVRIAQPLAQDSNTFFIVHGLRTVAAGDDAKRLRLSQFSVNRQRPNGNRARLIVFHGFERSAGLATPSLVFKAPGDNTPFQTGAIESGSTQSIDVDSGTSVWEVKRSDGDVIYVSQSATLVAGGIYVVLISGLEGAPTFANQPRLTFISIPPQN